MPGTREDAHQHRRRGGDEHVLVNMNLPPALVGNGANVRASRRRDLVFGLKRLVMTDEVPLEGGRLTWGIVRVGGTVRRPRKPSSAFVARLLTHLETTGFDAAPRYLGQDELGRDMFNYIPGWAPRKFQRFADKQIREAGLLLRRFHIASSASALTGAHSVVCHNDAGPNNFVFRDGMPCALVDFDLAAPGERTEDLGYMAWA